MIRLEKSKLEYKDLDTGDAILSLIKDEKADLIQVYKWGNEWLGLLMPIPLKEGLLSQWVMILTDEINARKTSSCSTPVLFDQYSLTLWDEDEQDTSLQVIIREIDDFQLILSRNKDGRLSWNKFNTGHVAITLGQPSKEQAKEHFQNRMDALEASVDGGGSINF